MTTVVITTPRTNVTFRVHQSSLSSQLGCSNLDVSHSHLIAIKWAQHVKSRLCCCAMLHLLQQHNVYNVSFTPLTRHKDWFDCFMCSKIVAHYKIEAHGTMDVKDQYLEIRHDIIHVWILHGCTYTDCRYTYNIHLIYLNIMYMIIHMYRYVYIYTYLHTNSPLYPCIWILRARATGTAHACQAAWIES